MNNVESSPLASWIHDGSIGSSRSSLEEAKFKHVLSRKIVSRIGVRESRKLIRDIEYIRKNRKIFYVVVVR